MVDVPRAEPPEIVGDATFCFTGNVALLSGGVMEPVAEFVESVPQKVLLSFVLNDVNDLYGFHVSFLSEGSNLYTADCRRRAACGLMLLSWCPEPL